MADMTTLTVTATDLEGVYEELFVGVVSARVSEGGELLVETDSQAVTFARGFWRKAVAK